MSKEVVIDFDTKVNYDFFKLDLKPLDLLVFKGSSVISKGISIAQQIKLGNGDISHVGLVVTSDILPFYIKNGKKVLLDTNERYIFESTGKGVIFTNLRDVISKYIKNEDCHVGWCKMKFPHIVTSDKFKPIFEKYYGRKYDLSFLNLAGSLYPVVRFFRNIKNRIINWVYSTFLKDKENPSKWQFCSELVANVLLELKILYDIVPDNVMPMDFLGYDKENVKVIYNSPVFFEKVF